MLYYIVMNQNTNLVPEKHVSLAEFKRFNAVRFHERHTHYVQTGENPTTARVLLITYRGTSTLDLFQTNVCMS